MELAHAYDFTLLGYAPDGKTYWIRPDRHTGRQYKLGRAVGTRAQGCWGFATRKKARLISGPCIRWCSCRS